MSPVLAPATASPEPDPAEKLRALELALRALLATPGPITRAALAALIDQQED